MTYNPNFPIFDPFLEEVIHEFIKGAKLIVVDPRFTRTAAKADLYAPMRSGTDIAFLGGMIKYILNKSLYFKDYVVNYTNASFLVSPEFKGPGQLDGLFSGYNPKTKNYDKKTWAYQMADDGTPKRDLTLRDPDCVFRLLTKHYARYTPEKVSEITGTPQEKLLEVYKLFTSTGRPDRAGTELYAMGWTQHTIGTQNIRTMSIIQLLLGNIGIAGGGINALRGESNVQGSTDHGLLFHNLPGYLATPGAALIDLKTYIEKHTPKSPDPKSANWWSNRSKYITSYLKAIYGDSANKKNDFAYAWLPKLDEKMDCSWLTLFDRMLKDKFEGFFAWGQNPACSSSNAGKALTKLKWMVNVNLFDNETASFWKGPGMDPTAVRTEVFLLPASSSVEKEGSITNSARLAQWRTAAISPVGGSMPDSEIINELYYRVKKLYQIEGGKFLAPITHLTWNYGEIDADGKVSKVDIHAVAREINGYYLEDVYDKKATPPKLLGKKGELCASFIHLQDDGSTSCGNWLYSQSYTRKEGKIINMMARRKNNDPTGLGIFPEWAWCWHEEEDMAARKSLLISPEVCIGCRACQTACKEWNQLAASKTSNTGSFENPPDLTPVLYNKIRYAEVPAASGELRWLFVSQRCMHCGDAGCMKICPAPGALYKTTEGAVASSKEKCIGCKLCVTACPFNVPRYDAENKIAKCHLCSDRIAAGQTPACAKVCTTGAIRFGARDSLLVFARQAGYTKVYGEKDLDGLGALYAFRDAPKVYGMEERPVIPESVIFWNNILKPLSYWGLGGAVALALIHYFAFGPQKQEEVNHDG